MKKNFEFANTAERREKMNAVYDMPKFAAYAALYDAAYMVKGVSVC